LDRLGIEYRRQIFTQKKTKRFPRGANQKEPPPFALGFFLFYKGKMQKKRIDLDVLTNKNIG